MNVDSNANYILPAGTVIFTAENTAEGVQAAQKYARRYQYKRGEIAIAKMPKTAPTHVRITLLKPCRVNCVAGIKSPPPKPQEH